MPIGLIIKAGKKAATAADEKILESDDKYKGDKAPEDRKARDRHDTRKGFLKDKVSEGWAALTK